MKNLDLLYKGGSVIAGMLGSEMGADAIGGIVPVENEHKNDAIQLAMGVGSIATLGRKSGIIGTVATYAGLGAIVSGILGLLKLKIPYIAQAGEEGAINSFYEEDPLLASAGEEYLYDNETGELLAVASAGEEYYYDSETGELVASAGVEDELVYEEVDPIASAGVAPNLGESDILGLLGQEDNVAFI